MDPGCPKLSIEYNDFIEFAAIVQECQQAKDLPQIPNFQPATLIYASVHGLIDLQAGGRMRREKGLKGVSEGVDLLIKVLSQSRRSNSKA